MHHEAVLDSLNRSPSLGVVLKNHLTNWQPWSTQRQRCTSHPSQRSPSLLRRFWPAPLDWCDPGWRKPWVTRPWAQLNPVMFLRVFPSNTFFPYTLIKKAARHHAKRHSERCVPGLAPVDSGQRRSETVGTDDRVPRAEAVVTAPRVSVGAGPLPGSLHVGAEANTHQGSGLLHCGQLLYLDEPCTGREAHAACLWVVPRLPQPPPRLHLDVHQAEHVCQPHGHYHAARLPCPFTIAMWANNWVGGLPAWAQCHACVLVPFINVMHFFLPCFRVPMRVKGWMWTLGCRSQRVFFRSWWWVCHLNWFLLVFNIMKDGRVKCKIQF